MVNTGEFFGGAALGAGFGAVLGPVADAVTGAIEKSMDFEPSLENLRYTQKSLKPCVDQIEALNIPLGYPDQVKDLQAKMIEGDALENKLKDVSAWDLGRPFYTDQLDELEESRRTQLGILKVLAIRDVKENLVLARESKTDVQQIVTWTGQTTNQFHEMASDGKDALSLGRDTNKKITEFMTGLDQEFTLRRVLEDDKVTEAMVEQAALGISVKALRCAVDEALLKPSPAVEEIFKRACWVEIIPIVQEHMLMHEAIIYSARWGIPPEDLKAFRIEIGKGVEVVRKCSEVTEWTRAKTVKYTNKILGLEKTLEALAARLKQNTTFLSPKEGLESTQQSNYAATNLVLEAPQKRIIT